MGFAPQVIGLFPPSKESATPVYNQVHQQQIGAKETTQNMVEIPTVQVIALEIPGVQIVERIQEQIVVESCTSPRKLFLKLRSKLTDCLNHSANAPEPL